MEYTNKFKDYIEEGKDESCIYIRVPAKDIAKLYTPLVNLFSEYFKFIELIEQRIIEEKIRYRAQSLPKEMKDTKEDLCI